MAHPLLDFNVYGIILQGIAEEAPRFVSFCKLVACLTQSILVKTMRFEKTRDIEVHALPEELKNQVRSSSRNFIIKHPRCVEYKLFK